MLGSLDRLHTTPMGEARIRKNLALDVPDVAAWCREKTASAGLIERKGKNWYVHSGCAVITVNAHSYTVITAHNKPREI